MYLAEVPLRPGMAIVPRGPDRAGLGAFDILSAVPVVGSIIGGLFGKSEKSSQRRAEERMAAMELQWQREQLAAQVGFGKDLLAAQERASLREAEIYDRATQAALTAARERAQAERASVRDAYDAQLESVRIWRSAQADQAANDLAMGAQSGILSVAQTTLAETGAQSRSFGRTAVTGIAVAGVAAFAAFVLMDWKGPGKSKRRRGAARRRSSPVTFTDTGIPREPAGVRA